ncbi:hypothetical protein B9479_004825 [Cryptococcus floricola]|uniref:Uncharacterized protein n=1 Tax=Cryptococcus floricola TaxID=2591691 RepID=A0A5D3AW67_9TREE|nr:hypothetical protein B9479_004825 [Cryptococcus floricola]
MSQADQQDANPTDPSVEDDRSHPADDRFADADHDKETEPESTPAPPPQGEVEPEDPFLRTIPSKSCSKFTSEGSDEHLILQSRHAMGNLIRYGAPGSQNSETGAHYLELGTMNGNNEWISTWNDAPGLKLNSEWSRIDMCTQLDMYMRRG